jgi:hypothetical protein
MDGNMRETSYVSNTLPSKGLMEGAGGRVVHVSSTFLRVFFVGAAWVMTMSAFSCATGQKSHEAIAVGLVAGPAPTVEETTTVTMAGARCSSGACQCREPGHDDAETAPPSPGSKRFEIVISAVGGTAALDLTDLGRVATGAAATGDTCAYIDVPAGSTHDAVFIAKESRLRQGVAPRLRIAEYGPKGPYWYDLVAVTCDGPNGRCDRKAADDWAATARRRSRGRIEPCGSAVVTKLAWETSGGQGERDGGLFRDFSTRFTMEVKKFATQFAPGSTECMPK